MGTTEAEDDEEEITSTAMPTSTTTVALCPIIVCPWNDTIGYFTPTPKPGFDDDDFSNSTLPCRGDNPTGCTPYWTSTRDSAQTVSSLHSSTLSTEPIGTLYLLEQTTQPCIIYLTEEINICKQMDMSFVVLLFVYSLS